MNTSMVPAKKWRGGLLNTNNSLKLSPMFPDYFVTDVSDRSRLKSRTKETLEEL